MELVQAYKILGDESRLRIINLLSTGYFSVQEVTAVLQLGQPTISHHLKTLGSADFVRSLRNGNHIFYSLNQDTNNQLVSTLLNQVLTLSNTSGNTLTGQLQEDRQLALKLIEQRRAETKDYFNSIAKNWRNIREEAIGQENFLEMVRDMIGESTTCLELGCGTGALLNVLLPRTGQTIGVDASQGMLDEAQKALGARAKQVDLRLGYIEHLPVGDESVETAVAYMVLHHLNDPRLALQEARRVLKADGKLIIVDLLKHDKEYMRTRFADVWLGFSQEQIANWAREAGFSSVSTQVLGKKEEVFILTCNK